MFLHHVTLAWFLSSAASAEATLVKTEAQQCQEALTSASLSTLKEQLQAVQDKEVRNQRVLELQRKLGEITTQEDYDRKRLALTFGDTVQEALLPEAIYQVFRARYGNMESMIRALRAFKDMTGGQEQGELLGEVIERMLQFVTDVDADNLAYAPVVEKFVGLSPGAMANFRAQWLVYDSQSQFVQILQNGIISALISANDRLVTNVVERHKPIRRLIRWWYTFKVPPRPNPRPVKMAVGQIQIENQEYYDTTELKTYLDASSTAARRYFIGNRTGYLTREQLDFIRGQARTWRLRDRNVEDIGIEIAWRDELRRKWEPVRDLRRDIAELTSRIDRLEDRHVYDKDQIMERMGVIGAEMNASRVAEMASDLLNAQAKRCGEVQFARLVGKITDVANARLRAAPDAALAFIDDVVSYANGFNLADDQLRSVQQDLTQLAGVLPARAQRRGTDALQKLVSTRPKFEKLKLGELKAELDLTRPKLDAATAELDRAYQR